MFISMLVSAFLSCFCPAQQQPFRSLDNETFAEEISVPGVQIVDVRTAREFEEGHIPGAVQIDVNDRDFLEKCRIGLDTGKTVAVYCRSGRRSKEAAAILAAAGYRVIELSGGFLGWDGETEKSDG